MKLLCTNLPKWLLTVSIAPMEGHSGEVRGGGRVGALAVVVRLRCRNKKTCLNLVRPQMASAVYILVQWGFWRCIEG